MLDTTGATALQRLVEVRWLVEAQQLIEAGFSLLEPTNEKVCPLTCLLMYKKNNEINKLLNFVLSKLTLKASFEWDLDTMKKSPQYCFLVSRSVAAVGFVG